jgi:VIT1/CCC1 family predicted Fe2+/Mn2+ transporter
VFWNGRSRKAGRARHAQAESEHVEGTGSGVLRAAIFGASDGLVSNLGLVMGVAGGGATATTVVLAGSAGLLAGAFSMAVGEYVSMQVQREAMERQFDLEREHILRYPREEQAHLSKLLVERGLSEADALRVASLVHEDVEPAVDFHARFELGIVPGQMGRPTGAAFSSFASFVVGAAVPLLPWFVSEHALAHSIAISAVALLVVGASVTRITQRNPIYGALRQLAFGAAAAAGTYGIGHWIGSAL